MATAAELPKSGESGAVAGRYRPGYELVAERILQYIAQENLKPGVRLPTEEGLAEILGTTRNVTREAVKVLADGSLQAYNAQPRAGSSYLLCCNIASEFPEPVVLPEANPEENPPPSDEPPDANGIPPPPSGAAADTPESGTPLP